MKSTYFTLTRLGRDKGYAEKREIETSVKPQEAMDLSKLTTEQLSQMRDMLTEAGVASGDEIRKLNHLPAGFLSLEHINQILRKKEGKQKTDYFIVKH